MSFFLKNLSALNNPYLMEKLKQKHSSTWVMDNKKKRGGVDQLNWINQNGEYLYKNPKKYLEETIALYQNKYLLYPVLYFYGFGSGVLYKCLLNNPNLKHIVVFEDDLELLYSVFSVLDFSNELKERKIIILNSEISNQDLEYLLYIKPFYNFLRIYDMHIHNEYYEKFENNILELNKKFQKF